MKKIAIMRRLVVSVIVMVSLVFPLGKAFGELKGKLIIFHAGSLTVPFEKMEREFEKLYPKVDILREPAGSVRCARKITELKKPCDIMVSADFTVIDRFLIPQFANWNIQFATNQLVLCYTDKSRHADIINRDNWYDILSRKGVVWGHSDPDIDPCGYRSLMVIQLAEIYYNKPGLYKRCIDNRPRENIRPKSVELISLLQTGNMDYAFEYLSVAVQHNLNFIRLPDEINLGSPEYAYFYKRAKVNISGEKPGEYIEVKGKPIVYGITLLKDAPQRKIAIAFLKYLLTPEKGLLILNHFGQPPLVPSLVADEKMREGLPVEIKDLVRVIK